MNNKLMILGHIGVGGAERVYIFFKWNNSMRSCHNL